MSPQTKAKFLAGGLLVSQLLTLFTTPIVYIYMDRVSSWLDGQFRSHARQTDGASEIPRKRYRENSARLSTPMK